MKKRYMGIDQYNNTYHGLVHPRKDLIEKTGYQHVGKMYVDKKDGRRSVHVGYIVGPLWIALFEVIPFEGGVLNG